MKGRHYKSKESRAGKRFGIVLLILLLAAGLAAGVYYLITGGVAEQVIAEVQGWIQAADTPATEPSTTEGTASAATQEPVARPTTAAPAVRVPGDFSCPTSMRGVFLQPGMDFLAGTQDGKTVKAELDAVLEQLETWEFNTLFIPVTDNSGRLLYDDGAEGLSLTDEGGAPFSLLGYAASKAKERGVYVYFVLDLGVTDGKLDPRVKEQRETYVKQTAALLANAVPDGFLLTGYTVAAAESAATDPFAERYAAITQTGITQLITAVTGAIKEVNNNYYIGLLADTAPTTAEGSEPTLTAGQAPVSDWLRADLIDFVLADIPVTVEQGFADTLAAFDLLCQSTDTPLYVRHASSGTLQKEDGWKSPDQLTKQLLLCQKAAGWNGSAYDSFSALKADTGNCTTVLLTAFQGTVQTDFIANQLNVTKPSKTKFTTKESGLTFSGSADPNFPLTINGETVTVTKKGYFSWNTELKPGENTVTVSHKGTTKTYRVTYELTLIDSVYPGKSMKYEEGTEIQLSAVARSGSKVYAMVNGTRVNMEVIRVDTEEDAQLPTDFETYAGFYTMPKGKIGSKVSLGSITFYATYQGQTVKKTGGSLTVEAVTTTTTTTTTTVVTTTTTSTGTGSETGTTATGSEATATGGTANSTAATAPKLPASLKPLDPTAGGKTLATGQIVVVNTDFAMTSDPAKPGNNRPDYAFLPRGTMDVVKKKISASSGTYYVLGSGNTVQTKFFTEYAKNGKLTANTFKANTAEVGVSHTNITLSSLWRVPYNITMEPVTYPYEKQYLFDITDQTMTRVDITFYYTATVPKAPDVSGSPLFKSAQWVKGENNTYILRLTLKKAGEFYGYSAAWDEQGNLTFAFKHPFAIGTGSKPLTGMRIVLDPGHGGSSSGAVKYPAADGSYTTEAKLVLQYSKVLKKQLEAKGAMVIMTRTKDSECPELEDRVAYARNNNTDLFISVHMDGFNGVARGCSTHYFNEYSYDLASRLFEGMKTAWLKYDPKQAQTRDARWNSFYVARLHDCPSVLLECGFLDTPADREILTTDAFIEDFCAGVVSGIENYYKSVTLEKVTLPSPTTTALPTTAASSQTTAEVSQTTTTASQSTAVTSQTTVTASQTTAAPSKTTTTASQTTAKVSKTTAAVSKQATEASAAEVE